MLWLDAGGAAIWPGQAGSKQAYAALPTDCGTFPLVGNRVAQLSCLSLSVINLWPAALSVSPPLQVETHSPHANPNGADRQHPETS